MDNANLIRAAFEARRGAYAPYSKYRVGAALYGRDGKITGGCNIENSSYGLCNCAERTAFFKAVSEGRQDFEAIAIVGGIGDGDETLDYAFPCGACRQVMREFTIPELFKVIVARSEDDYREFTLSELLPNSFGPESII